MLFMIVKFKLAPAQSHVTYKVTVDLKRENEHNWTNIHDFWCLEVKC